MSVASAIGGLEEAIHENNKANENMITKINHHYNDIDDLKRVIDDNNAQSRVMQSVIEKLMV